MSDLFAYRYPQTPGAVVGSDTSEAAAESIKPTVNKVRNRVMDFVNSAILGATCDEVEVGLNLSHQTASARLRELVLMSLISDSGMRRPTRSGRWARVYVRGVE